MKETMVLDIDTSFEAQPTLQFTDDGCDVTLTGSGNGVVAVHVTVRSMGDRLQMEGRMRFSDMTWLGRPVQVGHTDHSWNLIGVMLRVVQLMTARAAALEKKLVRLCAQQAEYERECAEGRVAALRQLLTQAEAQVASLPPRNP